MVKTANQRLYYEMRRIRAVERAIAAAYPEKQIRCPIHLSIGQEAAAVGVCSALDKTDYCVSTHRGHAHYLAKGGSLGGLISELYGKETGCSRGYGSSMHLVDRSCGFYGSTSIVGGTIPIGVGLAFAKKIRGQEGVSVVFVGDAALEEGVYHESANFASIHQLPVIFVCENNFYSCYTHISERQPKKPFKRFADAHDLAYFEAPGNYAPGVAGVTKQAKESALMQRPAFLYLETWRELEHCGPFVDDQLGYRDPEYIEMWKRLDPLDLMYRDLFDSDEMSIGLLTQMDQKINLEIEQAFNMALRSDFPRFEELELYEYASPERRRSYT